MRAPPIGLRTPMNLLQVYNRPLGGGGEEVVVRQTEAAFSSIGIFNTVWFDSAEWTGQNAPPKWKQAFGTLYNNTAVARLRAAQTEASARAWIFHTVFPVGSPALYHEALRQKVPIVQYIHNFRPFASSAFVRSDDSVPMSRSGERFITEVRTGAWQNSALKTFVFASALALLRARWMKAVKAWAAPSDFMRRKFIEAGVSEKHIFTLRYPWQARQLTAPREQDFYLYLGHLNDAKGIKVMIEAWHILRQKLATNAPRLLVGGTGPLADWLRQQTKLNPSIEYTGPIFGDEKQNALANCRAMVVPTLCAESLGLVTYEAYDYAKPVCAARSGALEETVNNSETGFLHTPGKAEELAEHIIQLEASEIRRRNMGLQGRLWLEKQPTLEQWTQNFQQIIDYALANK
ncbi:MAG: glycosyltransferase [Verrucomicrobiales bacterium]|nr:glycosyltransferase [Verrucomicrobiales bacterium]